MRRSLHVALACLSLANLLFLSGWRVLLNPAHYTYYHWKNMPGYAEPISLFADILIVATLLWGSLLLARRWGINSNHIIARVVAVLILLVIANNVRIQFGSTGSGASGPGIKWLIIPALFMAGAIFYARRSIGRLTFGALLVLSPVFPLFVLQSLYLVHKSIPNQLSAVDRTAGEWNKAASKEKQRVVWVIFDELDENTAFEGRRPGLALPAFDRLRSESLAATNAFAPVGDTLYSMPSLITGRTAGLTEPIGPNELRLYMADGQIVNWSTLSNVFSESRQLGFNTALVGWYHSYCRVIGPSLNRCFWQTATSEIVPIVGQLTIGNSMKVWFEKALFNVPFMFRVFQSIYEKEFAASHIQEYESLQAEACATLADARVDLMLLHFPVPHHPWIYDPAKQSLSTGPNPIYEGNLVLADRTLSEIRNEMEANGTWDLSAVLVSADHWWRESPVQNGQKRDRRVPFLLKLPGESAGVSYEKPMNTILTRDLLIRLLKRDLTTYEEVSNWLGSRQDSMPNYR